MTDNDHSRFNLVFSGQLLPGTDNERAKRTLAAFFGLRDTSGVSVFFSGKPVPLRRNITRNDAQRLYQQLRSVGLICELLPADKPTPSAPAPAKEPLEVSAANSTLANTASEAATSPSSKTSPSSLADEKKKSRTARPTAEVLPRGHAPNLFALRPAFGSLNTAQLREAAQIRCFVAAGAALALCAIMLAVIVRFPGAPAGQEPLGALAGTTLASNELVLLVEGALLIHERSGLPRERISAADLGFSRLAPPLWAMNNGDLLLNAAFDDAEPRLQRCDLEETRCYTFSPEILESPVMAIASSLLGDNIFLLGERGQLWRSNSAGVIQDTSAVQLPWGEARILSSGGLLLIPAGDGPMLGVYRPDQQNFGQQLDALLVMPPAAIAAGQDRLRDVAQGDANYWALMAGNEAAPGLYRLDQQWGSPANVTLPEELVEPYFINWRDKLLVADKQQAVIQRVASDGRLEAPFDSPLLREERQSWIALSEQRRLMRQLGIGLPLIIVLLCSVAALLYLASYRALGTVPQERTALLDPLPAGIHWLPDSARKDPAVTQLGMGLVLISLLTLGLLGSMGGWQQAATFMPMLVASAYAWSELRRGSGGHLGLLDTQFICVDHDGRYFYGKRSFLRGNASIVLAPQVVLPVSLPVLPNLDTTHLNKEHFAAPISSSYPEILGALWLSRHPWLNAALATATGLLLSSSLLVLIG